MMDFSDDISILYSDAGKLAVHVSARTGKRTHGVVLLNLPGQTALDGSVIVGEPMIRYQLSMFPDVQMKDAIECDGKQWTVREAPIALSDGHEATVTLSGKQ